MVFFRRFFRRRRTMASLQEFQEQLGVPVVGEQRTYMPDVPYLLPKDAKASSSV